MPKSIYLNSRSDLRSITKLLNQVRQADVVLVVPKSSRLFTRPGALRALAKTVEELGKGVTIATVSPGGRQLALAAGFRVIKGKEKRIPLKRRVVRDLAPQKKSSAETLSDVLPKTLPSLPEAVRQVLPEAPVKRSIRSLKNPKVLAAGLVALILIVLAFFVLPEARIVVATRSETVTRDLDIQVNAEQKEADPALLTIPGRVISKEVEGSKSFTPTGRRNIGKKASGFVQIYNLSKTSLVLRAGTTVLSVGGRRYAFTQDAAGIRPTAFIGQGDEQEVDPSSLLAPVPVIALEPGEEYNLGDGSRVEISNEVFGARPAELYAQASGNITGGSTLQVKVLTETDVEQALEVVREEAVSQAGKDLSQDSEGLTLLESGVLSEVIEQSVSHQPGAQIDEFSAAVKLQLNALVYSRDDVLAVIQNRVERLLPENKHLSADEDAVLESRFFVTNLEDGTGVLTSHFESQINYSLSAEDLTSKVKGKSVEEISELLLSRPEIESVNVKLSPVWVQKAPRLSSRISIEFE